MSSAVISTTAAQGRFFVFDPEADLGVLPDELRPEEVWPHGLASLTHPAARALTGPAPGQAAGVDPLRRKERWLEMTTPASRMALRPASEMASSGIAEIDALTGGLPRGCLTEIFGPASSGRTNLLLATLAAATSRGEVCAVVDTSDALDPQSAAFAGIDLDRLLWVRCGEYSPQGHPSASLRAGAERERSDKQIFKSEQNELHSAERRLEQLLRATDLLLESGGFGLIALDLCDLPLQAARRIPLTTWFRFRRAVERMPTVLLAIERQPIAGSCSSLSIKLGLTKPGAAGNRTKEENAAQVPGPAHAHLLTTVEITAEVVRSRLERKPAGSVSTAFAGKTAWAG